MKYPTFVQHALPALVLAMSAVTGSALAQYKVVGPDGSITYTDRPPADSRVRITALNARTAAASAPATPLPLELRDAVGRYPVTLYVAQTCAPCEPARALLRQRGIPYSERIVLSEDDLAELVRIVGSRNVPSLTIGSQVISGLNDESWNSYLDAAGYPRESKLPPGYQNPPPAPVVTRSEAAPPSAPAAAAAPREPTPIEVAPPPNSGFRF